MITVLFSPSEGKNEGGSNTSLNLFGGVELRKEILNTYNTIVNSANQEEIQNLFGYKKFSQCEPYIVDIFNAPTLKAIERYDGVAYDYLKYNSLENDAKEYIDTHVVIFSNLFGAIFANDAIPIYKVKQGNAIGEIKPELYYKEKMTSMLDEYLKDKEILDLRAGYYDKFYKPNKPYTTLKFLKNKKVVSHWAKAYRGLVLQTMARHQVSTLDAFVKLPMENLCIEEIRKQKNKTEIIYSILT
jgi:cytoplasmic iron level regulating protein YaaA (DUF328/UPF0246 family)